MSFNNKRDGCILDSLILPLKERSERKVEEQEQEEKDESKAELAKVLKKRRAGGGSLLFGGRSFETLVLGGDKARCGEGSVECKAYW